MSTMSSLSWSASALKSALSGPPAVAAMALAPLMDGSKRASGAPA
eukprot:CAMPEP_0185904720 /NCGR_PEP_ID=MMETSP0196C-20130402/3999_1 /TAXON_ID=2932 /ORGANISM="Alexandrium fundyense, Strain CCMP1719" /LENGTH=44 /DNA_ID= /DNA_START= /DNA_END= /DNA_ORIENTATION=